MFSGLAFKLFLGLAVLSTIGGGIGYIKILQLRVQIADRKSTRLNSSHRT